MGIEKRQPGAAKAAAAAGTVIGTAAREKEDRARVEREQARADQEAAQRQARQTAMKWDLQKMQITSERAFERELRQEDYQLAAEDRAAAWQIEKLELTSRMDFEMEQKEYVRDIDRAQVVVDAYEKEGREGRTDLEKDPVAKQAIWQARQDLKDAKAGKPSSKAPNLRAEERAENRETRAAQVHRRKEADAPTKQELAREEYETFLGDWSKALSLPELEVEAKGEGFVPQQDAARPLSNIPYPTPNSQEAYDAIPSGSTYIDSAGNERTKS